MITRDEWSILYNEVFKIIPPSEDMNLLIFYDDGKIKHTFFSMCQFLVYLSLQQITIIDSDAIHYRLLDDTLYNKIQDALKRMKIFERV